MKTRCSIFIFWFLTVSHVILSQQVVSGRITDAADGTPLAYASVAVANTTIGTYSDESGNYKLTISGNGSYEIIVHYLGYQPVFHKIDKPKPFHQIDIALKINEVEIQEVSVMSAKSKHKQNDIDMFWRIILGVKPSKDGLEVLNPKKVNFYLGNTGILTASCEEPIEIINHELGYHISYVLQSFRLDYPKDEVNFYGRPYFEELKPKNINQQKLWEKKRQDVYAISITHFIRALYQKQIYEEGFLLVKRDPLLNSNTIFPLNDILRTDQNQVLLTIESPLYLACFSKPVTDKMFEDSYKTMFVSTNHEFPVVLLHPQQIYIYSDGTYSGNLDVSELRKRFVGLSARLPIEYNLSTLPLSTHSHDSESNGRLR